MTSGLLRGPVAGGVAIAVASVTVGVFAAGAEPEGDRVGAGGSLCFQLVGDPGDLAVVNVSLLSGGGTGHVSLRSSDDPPDGPGRISSANFGFDQLDQNLSRRRLRLRLVPAAAPAEPSERSIEDGGVSR